MQRPCPRHLPDQCRAVPLLAHSNTHDCLRIFRESGVQQLKDGWSSIGTSAHRRFCPKTSWVHIRQILTDDGRVNIKSMLTIKTMGKLTTLGVYPKLRHRDPIASTSAVHPATSQPRTSFLKPWLYECNNACIFLTISLLAACSAGTAAYYLAWLHSGTAPGPWKLPQSLTMAGYRSSIFYEPLLMTLFRRANRFSLTVCRHYAARSQLWRVDKNLYNSAVGKSQVWGKNAISKVHQIALL